MAYRCSFRVTEAMFFQERMVAAAAADLGIDAAEIRRHNLLNRRPVPAPHPRGRFVGIPTTNIMPGNVVNHLNNHV